MKENGTGVQPLTTPGSQNSDVQANWSPNSNDVVFARGDSGNGADLYIVHANGTGLRQLTNTPGRVELEPAWSPDGTKIAFHGCTDAGGPNQHCAVYTINPDVNGETEISTPHAPYLDTFSGDRIDPFWGTPFVTGSGPTITEQDGHLDVRVPSSSTLDPTLGYISLGLAAPCLLVGDFDIQVDYQLPLWPPANGVNLSLDTFDIVNGSYGQVHGMFVFDPGGGTGISTHFPGANTFVSAPELFGTLRLSRSGTILTAFRLVSGTWVPLQSTTDDAVTVGFNLNVFSNVPPPNRPDVEVAYDNFRVNSGALSCPTWWDDSSPDWQPTIQE